jgi:ribosomal protein S18 acetylase RimI-like enzyme
MAAVLARAFYDDPVSAYIFPAERRRVAGLERFFKIHIRFFIDHGEPYTTDPVRGSALWLPPVRPRTSTADLLRQLPMVPMLGRRLSPTLRLLRLLEMNRPQLPHYYLATLGTDPPCQRKGIGSALLEPVLSRCDEQRIPSYLETSTAENVVFYRRHGFEVTKELDAPDGGPRLWLMWREPVLS